MVHRATVRRGRASPSSAPQAWLLLILAVTAFEMGAADRVAVTSKAHGSGPANIPAPTYVKGRTCGVGPYTRAWDKQMGPFNDSSYNPLLKPVTEFRVRSKGTVQTVWDATQGPEHGFLDETFQNKYKLRPYEVINKIEFVNNAYGFWGNITLFTNQSNEIQVNWTLSSDGSEQLVQAAPPEDRIWNGRPIVGSWYLAYMSADIVGFCIPQNRSSTLSPDGPVYFVSPIFYFTWAAEVGVAAASPVPSPPPAAIPSPGLSPPAVSPSPDPKKKKDNKIVIIGGAVGGIAALIILGALGWVWLRHGKELTSVGKAGGGGAAAAAAAAAGGGGAAAAGAGGGAAAGVAAGGYNKDVELAGMAPATAAGGAAMGMAVPGTGPYYNRDLPPSQPMVHPTTTYPTHAAAAYPGPQHSTYSYPAGHPDALPSSSPFLDPNTVSPRPSTANSLAQSISTLPPSASATGSEQPVLGKGAAAAPASTISMPTGGHASTVVKGSKRPAAMMAPGGGMSGPGAMMHGGGAGGAATVGPMAAVGAAGIAVMGTVILAREILDAGDRVVANHARCLRLTSRIHSILPLLNCLHEHLEREAATKGHQANVDLQTLINNMNAVFSDVRDCINRWCGSETTARRGVMLQVLRNLMVSRKFEDEFLDLNERLSVCYQDLILALNIKRTVMDNDPARLKKQHEEDVAADLKGVAEELSTEEGEQAWNSLPSEEKETIRSAFFNYGLNFNAVMTQVRKNAIGERVKDLIIPWSDIKIYSEIGSGGYGTVYRGTWQDIDVAVKKLQLTIVTERAKRELSHEAYVMSLLRHPNVATSYGMVLQPPNCALVMKFYRKGTLLELLHDDAQPLTLRRKLQLAMDVAKGMAYLHNRPTDPVIHGDLKPSNLLIDDDGRVVITDFGLSHVSTLTLTTRPSSSAMSVTYTAPEILADPTSKRTPAADVYAYGLVLFEIFTRGLPFESAADVMAVVQYVLGGGRPKVAGPDFEEQRVPAQVVRLMQDCWCQVPQARPTFSDIVDQLKAIEC